MILPIYVYGSAVLRQEAQEITPDYPDLKKFLADLWETMYEADGVGLAAPQVGKSIRVFVVDVAPGPNEKGITPFKQAFINPVIYERFGEEWPFNDGCLSVPGIYEDVMRPAGIKIRYRDEDFVEHDEEYTGYAARVIQHEYDHLEGTMFVDKVSPLRKTLIKGKLLGISKGKYKADYRCKLVKK